MAEPLKPQDGRGDNSLLLVGLGNCGSNIVRWAAENFSPEHHQHLTLWALNLDGSQLDKLFGPDHKLGQGHLDEWLNLRDERFIVHPLGGRRGAGGDPAVAAAAVQEREKEFREICRRFHAVVLVMGLGKGTGSGAGPELARLAMDEHCICMAHATLPYHWEGEGHRERAAEARAKLLRTVPTFSIYNQNLFKVIGDEPILPKAAQALVNDRCILPQIMMDRELIQEVGDSNMDLEDLQKQILSHGTEGFMGFYEVSDQEQVNLETAVNALTQNPFMDDGIVVRGLGQMFWFHGTWSMQEIQGVVLGVRKKLQSEERGVNENMPGYIQEVEDKRKWVGLITIAKQEGEDLREEDIVVERSKLPQELAFPNWRPEFRLDLQGGVLKRPIWVDARFRKVWLETLHDPDATYADFERLIDFLVANHYWTFQERPKNPLVNSVEIDRSPALQLA